jgi:hypothetical protein
MESFSRRIRREESQLESEKRKHKYSDRGRLHGQQSENREAPLHGQAGNGTASRLVELKTDFFTAPASTKYHWR